MQVNLSHELTTHALQDSLASIGVVARGLEERERFAEAVTVKYLAGSQVLVHLVGRIL
jgi:hypothetical protein